MKDLQLKIEDLPKDLVQAIENGWKITLTGDFIVSHGLQADSIEILRGIHVKLDKSRTSFISNQ